MPTTTETDILPVTFRAGQTAESAEEIAEMIKEEANKQAAAKKTKDDGEFLLGCAALLTWRVRLRLEEDHGKGKPVNRLMRKVKDALCPLLGCDPDEFDMMLEGTKARPRVPFGYSPLELAHARARKAPIHVISKDSKILDQVAGIAYQLQQMNDAPIVLPVDDVRDLLEIRKLAISGALGQLIDLGVLEYVDPTYRTGRARTYRFVGTDGEDYEFADPQPQSASE